MDIKCFLPFLLSLYYCMATKRTIKKDASDIKCSSTLTVPFLHITSTNVDNADDVIHYIICTFKRPTVIIKHVMKPTTVTFNKTNICTQTGETFSFHRGGTLDVSGLIITKLYSYNDVKDEVSPQSGTHIDQDVLGLFDWTHAHSNGKEVVFKGTNDDALIVLTLHIHDESGHGEQQPRNPINANLTEFRVEMYNLTTNYKHTRYAAELVFFSTASADSHAEAMQTTTQYIDDEYTPGIFEIWAVKFLPELSSIKQTYVTWKPVSYNSPEWKRSDQGLVKKFLWKDNSIVKLADNDEPIPTYSGSVPWTLINATSANYYGVNVSFGIAKDGFYNKHRYLSWTGMVGSGTPPVDSMSMKIILTIAIGLGTPGVVILAGILFILVKRIQQSTESSYDEIH